MAVTSSSPHHTPDNDSMSSQESGSGGFTAVNRASSNESDDSSLRSSPNEDTKPHPSQPHNSYSAVNGHDNAAHKRKRSGSDDGRFSSPRQYDYSPPKRSEHPQHMADRALHVLGNGDHPEGPYYSHGNVDQNGHGWNHERNAHPQPEGSGANQREDVNYEGQPRWDLATTPNGQNGHEHFGQDSSANSASQGIPKRKRNFSNRTKTGCMTCRSRKKKCDEARPICNNCHRGGFPCAGYSMTRSTSSLGSLWSKTPGMKIPVPLQSKDGQSEGNDTPNQRPSLVSPSSNRSSVQLEGGQVRPASVDDHENPQHQFVASPPASEPRSRPTYPGHQWPPQQGQPQYPADHLPPLAELRPDMSTSQPPREMSRPSTQGGSTSQPPPSQAPQPPQQQQQHQQHQQPPPPPPAPTQLHPNLVHQQPGPAPAAQHQSHPAQHQPRSSHPQVHPPPTQQQGYWPPQPPEYRQTYATHPPQAPSHVDHHNPPSSGHARMTSASFDYHKSGAKTFSMEEVERSRMLRQSKYNHFDPTLVNERQRCERALARYNDACKLGSGMSDEDARNMLWKVIDPSEDTSHAFVAPLKEKGVLAHGVRVEAPFNCTYGYNLKLMDNVYIGKGCTIDDAAKVEIGARTWIGPNVTILTTEIGKDMVDRKGSAASWFAHPVVIASEVVIGQNAVIYPGIRLERGATVEAFAVVKDSLGPNETQKAPVGPRMTM